MKTQELLSLLRSAKGNNLEFEYALGQFVPATFHITEVKNQKITSVDCGGRKLAFNQTVVQLYVNDLEAIRKPWTTDKALSILDLVDKKDPMDKEAEVFFEWGHGELRTSVYSVEQIENDENTLSIKLFAQPTVCKPSLELASSAAACCN
ncbi:MAG: DUF6428 family protein [Imperialibacter sp.]|uniref:DUF6428 family protein n=1 Tax=Imperialibacter sp. TaxID=2038411 RepID=UPI0032EE5762